MIGAPNLAGMNEAQRRAIAMALLAQAQEYAAKGPRGPTGLVGSIPDVAGIPGAPSFAGGAAEQPYEYPTDPSDPADYSSGFTQEGSSLTGGLAPTGFAASVQDQAASTALGGFLTNNSTETDNAAPGTGLGLATQGYGSNLGHAHAANMADQAMTALSVMDAVDMSIAVNNAVEEGGYTSPSPAPDPGYTSPDPSSTIVGLPSDFSTAQASLSDTTEGGFGTGTGFSSADAANDAVGAALGAAIDAAGGFDAGPSGFDAGVSAGFDAGVSGGFDAGGSGEGGGGGGGGGGGSGK
jgi:hypothetical protein